MHFKFNQMFTGEASPHKTFWSTFPDCREHEDCVELEKQKDLVRLHPNPVAIPLPDKCRDPCARCTAISPCCNESFLHGVNWNPQLGPIVDRRLATWPLLWAAVCSLQDGRSVHPVPPL